MPKVTAVCPTSLSFIFKPCLPAGRFCPNKDLVKMGSIGVGCTLDKTVEAVTKPNKKTSVFFNGKPVLFPTVEYALSSLTNKPLTVEIKSSLPLGYGFGISSAATLASLFATNQLFSFGKENEELIRLAHIAEIKNRTGLGSVATQTTGGFLVKTTSGIPVANAVQLPFVGQKLYAIIIDKLETPSVLNNEKHLLKINQAADDALQEVKERKNLSLTKIIDIAYQFAYRAELITHHHVRSLINKIRLTGNPATMAILGQVVITITKPKLNTNLRIEELTITDNTVYIQ